MQLGTNVDPNHGFTVEELKNINASVARFPLWPDTGFDYDTFARDCMDQDITPLAVVDQRCLSYWKSGSNKQKITRLTKKYPNIFHFQLGNEPDGAGESSSLMSRYQYICLLRAGRKALEPNKFIVGAGMCGAQPYWYDNFMDKYGHEVYNLIDAQAIHQYGVTPSDDFPYPETGFGPAIDGINSIRSYGIPIWVTEFGGDIGLFDNEHQAAVWLSKMKALYLDNYVEIAIQFCYSDRMVDNFGMFRADGSPREIVAAFKD